MSPKLKTNKSIAKRFKVTGKGKVKRNIAGGSHLMLAKSPKNKRRLRQKTLVAKNLEAKIRNMLPK